MRFHFSRSLLAFVAFLSVVATAHALEKQPAATYHARRAALAQKLQGGIAIVFAAEEPLLDFMPYRQDEDFYYLTGWNEPGAALMIMGDAPAGTPARTYHEVLFSTRPQPAHGKVHRHQARRRDTQRSPGSRSR